MRFLSGLILALLLVSCSHLPKVQSGKYVQLGQFDTLESVARKYRVDAGVLKTLNRGKKFHSGEIVFVPVRGGILSRGIASLAFFEGRFLWPVPAVKKISSGFGERGGRPHNGIDIPAPIGTHVVAADEGVVIYSGNQLSGFGNLTVIDHENGTYSVYGHAHKNFTRKGQRVSRGEVIAQVGNTGRSSGPHLHFEIRMDEGAVDPQYLVGYNP